MDNCLGYCRVSTQRQFCEGHSLERYISDLKKYGLPDERIFWDIESGASDKRKGYNKVLELIRTGKYKKLIVPCFDRFTRNPLHWEVAREEFQQYSVKVEFLDGGGLDLETPEGLFTSRILAAVAAQVRDRNRYNSLQGHKFFRSQNKIYTAPFGYEKQGEHLVLNYEKYKDTDKSYYEVAREVIETFLYVEKTLSGTVRRLVAKYGDRKVKTKHADFPHDYTALDYWLRNEVLRGHIIYFPKQPDKRTLVLNQHPGLVSPEESKDIHILLEQNTKLKTRPDEVSNP